MKEFIQVNQFDKVQNKGPWAMRCGGLRVA